MALNRRQLALRRLVCWLWGHTPDRRSIAMGGDQVAYGDPFCARCKTTFEAPDGWSASMPTQRERVPG